MSRARVITTFLLLPLVLGLERGAFYSMRNALPIEITRAGGAHSDFSTVLQLLNGVNLAALVIAAAVGMFGRPIWLLLGGSVIAIGGYLVLAIGGRIGAPLWSGLILVGLGQGLGKPALFALAASEIAHPREQLRAALFVLLYGAVNAGAFFASLSAPFLILGAPTSLPFYVALGFQVLSAGFLVVLFAVGHATRAEGTKPADDAPRGSRVALAAALLALVLMPFVTESTLIHQAQYDVLRRAGISLSSVAALTGLNPTVVLFACGLMALCSVMLHFSSLRLPVLYAAAAGFCVTALAATPFVLYSSSTGSGTVVLPLAMAGLVGLAIGEVLVTPYVLSRMLGDAPPRFVTTIAALWYLVSGGLSTALFSVAPKLPELVPYLIAASAFLSLGLGVGGLFAIPALYRGFFQAAQEEGE